MNRRLKAVAIGAITAAAGIGVGTFGAEVALAHATIVSGTAVCQTNGTYTVTWKVENDFNAAEHVTLVSTTGGGQLSGLPADIAASPGQPYKFATVTQTNIPGTTNSASLTVKGTWADNYTQNDGASVSLPKDCIVPVAPNVTQTTVCGAYDTWATVNMTGIEYSKNGSGGTYAASQSGQFSAGNLSQDVWARPTAGYTIAAPNPRKFTITNGPVEQCSTPVAPTVTVHTECGVKDTFTAGPTTGVIYTPTSGSLNAGNNVDVVTATPAPGYKFSGAQSVKYSLVGSPIEPCTTTVTPVAPTVTTSSTCGVKDTFTAGPTTGVIYNPASGSLLEGQVVVITATPDAGYSFDGPQSVQFQVVGGPVEVCDTPVTPVAPNVTTTTTCGVADSFTAGPTTGVVYTPSSGTLPEGQSVNVTATPDAGYKFDGAQSVVFVLTGGTIEVCGQETTTTVGGVSEEPPTTASVVVVAPPAPEEPVTGLPETGSNNTATMLFGGFALIAGAAMLFAVRRRSTAK